VVQIEQLVHCVSVCQDDNSQTKTPLTEIFNMMIQNDLDGVVVEAQGHRQMFKVT